MIKFFSFCTEFTTTSFLKMSSIYLQNISDKIEQYENIETSYSDGVLNIILQNGKQFVINRQTPNKQIWYSSPISGPQRFNYINGQWKNSKFQELENQLLSEIQILLKQ